MKYALEKKEQALLFLNRRGYASADALAAHAATGWRARIAMPGWSITGSGAASSVTIAASRCRRRRCVRNAMPKDSFAPVGPGVERLQEEVANLFPDARTIVLSSDLFESVERLREELEGVAEGKFDIIIGTQLVAKGHHFPKLNLVGIVDADLGLGAMVIRARPSARFSFCIRWRAAPAAKPVTARGFLQTHQPEHPVMRAIISGDRAAFYDTEIASREATGYPPFGRLAAIVVSGGDRHETESFARKLAAASPLDESVRVLGPAEAPLAVVRGRYRFRLLDQVTAQCRSVAFHARLAGPCAEDARQFEAGSRYRSAEFF